MLNMIGACLLIVGGIGTGIMAGKRLKNRAYILRSLAESLRLLGSEIEFYCLRMEDLFAEIADRTQGSVSEFFSFCAQNLKDSRGYTLSEIWRQAVKEKLPMLKQTERDALLTVGAFLGRYDAEHQCRTALVAADRLNKLAEETEEEYRGKGKLYNTLGLAVGGIFAIFFI